MKTWRTGLFLLGGALLLTVMPACQQKMAVQPSYRPDQPSDFFRDGRSARPAVAWTVARGHLRTDREMFRGRQLRTEKGETPATRIGLATGGPLAQLIPPLPEDVETKTFPFPVNREVLELGQQRYMIYCVVCHDPVGTGQGKIVERGYTPPPSFHIPRLRSEPVGHFFGVITNGYGSMPSYGPQIPAEDRWAIIAYIRALQLSQHFPRKSLTEEMARQWEEQTQTERGHGDE